MPSQHSPLCLLCSSSPATLPPPSLSARFLSHPSPCYPCAALLRCCVPLYSHLPAVPSLRSHLLCPQNLMASLPCLNLATSLEEVPHYHYPAHHGLVPHDLAILRDLPPAYHLRSWASLFLVPIPTSSFFFWLALPLLWFLFFLI